jgi:hypothetical protein
MCITGLRACALSDACASQAYGRLGLDQCPRHQRHGAVTWTSVSGIGANVQGKAEPALTKRYLSDR